MSTKKTKTRDPGQPKDPVEACEAGRPLLYAGHHPIGMAAGWSLSVLGPDDLIARMAGHGAEAQRWAQMLANRWNTHHAMRDALIAAKEALGGLESYSRRWVASSPELGKARATLEIITTLLSEVES